MKTGLSSRTLRAFAIINLLLLLTACSSGTVQPLPGTPVPFATAQTASLTPRVDSPTPAATGTLTPTATITPTRGPTSTPQPSATFTQTPTSTPTYDPILQATITKPAPAVCPKVDPSYQPVFENQNVDGAWYAFDLSAPLLEALNKGASLSALKRAVSLAQKDGKPAEIPADAVYAKDVTGDGIPEVIFSDDRFLIYTCRNGVYSEVLHHNSGTARILDREIIADLNRDGLVEIVTSLHEILGFVSNNYMGIYRWNGSEFIDLIAERDCNVDGLADWSVVDTDGNGTLELVVRTNQDISFDTDLHGPWRIEIHTFTWNGASFVRQPVQLDPPEYRFQAVQDGDRAMRRGDYLKAIYFFQEAANNPDLKGWGYSFEHFMQRLLADPENPTPTPLPLDPNEAPVLAAYAHYRIILAQVALNQPAQAKAEYETLQKAFPAGKPGSAYADLAKVFWEQYQKGVSRESICRVVTDYATQHEETIMQPVNNYSMGFQNISYEPADLCLPAQ